MLPFAGFPDQHVGRLALRLLGYVAASCAAAFLCRLYQMRMMVRRAGRADGVFLMPHSFVFGHVLVVGKIFAKHEMPRDVHGHWMVVMLAREYPEAAKAGCVYLDVWPMSMPMLAVFHPDMMAQFTQVKNQPKHWQMANEFRPFSGLHDIVNLEGKEWKAARSLFNPGFSAGNLISQIPGWVEEVMVFREKLAEFAAEGQVVQLEDYSTNLSVDIIGRAVLGERLQAQKKPVKLMQTMLRQVALLHYDMDLRKSLNPLTYLHHWRYNRIFRGEMMPYVQKVVDGYSKAEGPKTILSLAVRSFVNDVQEPSTRGNIPAEFLEKVVSNIKMFLFAGHDTTATTLAYAYHELSVNGGKLALIRAEHDAVLGPDASQTADIIKADPSLVNQLPYTLAVVKETLRLWPVVGTVRIGTKGFYLEHPVSHVRYAAEDFTLFGCSAAVQRNPEFWPEPDSFIPERWLTRDESDRLRPMRNAFRPFEMGPRNCIGQELASLELRLILALTVREFDFEVCYSEQDRTFLGSKAYQVQTPTMITAHPKGGMPVRVRRRP